MQRITQQRQRTREYASDDLRNRDNDIEDDGNEEISAAKIMMMVL
jgi:hypothetical protein